MAVGASHRARSGPQSAGRDSGQARPMDVLADPGSVSRGEDQAGIRKAARVRRVLRNGIEYRAASLLSSLHHSYPTARCLTHRWRQSRNSVASARLALFSARANGHHTTSSGSCIATLYCRHEPVHYIRGRRGRSARPEPSSTASAAPVGSARSCVCVASCGRR